MKKFLLFTICVAMAMAFAVPSHAQRLIPKQKGIEVVGSIPLIKGEKLFQGNNFGMGVSLTAPDTLRQRQERVSLWWHIRLGWL